MPNEINERAKITVPWVELVKNFAPTTGHFAYDDSSHAQLIEVDWDDANQALEDILGTQYCDKDTLFRVPPLQHPEFPNLWATRCDTQNVQVTSLPPLKNQYGKSAGYEKTRITITYQALPYSPVWTKQAQSGKEWLRNVARVPHPTSDAYTLPTQTMGYVEGTPVPSPTGLPFQSQKIIGRSDIVWTWYNVPNDYLMDPVTGIASNIQGYTSPDPSLHQTPDGGIGKVNFTEFAGFPAGTLLCMPPLITPRIAPVPYLDVYTGENSVRLWNVQFTFKYYDPPLGPGCTTRGHNTAIWKGDFLNYGTRSQLPSDKTNVFSGAKLYQTYEFTNLFAGANGTLAANA